MRIYPEDVSQFLEEPDEGVIPHAKILDPKKIELKKINVLCVFGLSLSLYAKVRFWLNQDSANTLIFVESQRSSIKQFFTDPKALKALESNQVRLYWLESDDHLEDLTNELAWDSVFLTLKTLEVKPSTLGRRFLEELEYRHLGVFLIASDTSDFGVSVMENVYANFRSRSSLLKAGASQSCFQIPAIICGAGPSFEKNAEAIRSLENQALIFAGGTALNVLEKQHIQPHFAAAIDKRADPRIFQQQNCWEVPFFFQARMQKKNFSLVHGPEILVSDSGGYLLERWLHEELGLGRSPENIGWNVTTFLTKVAVDLGCSPIIFVGMDLAYTNKPYSEGGPKTKEASVRVENSKGEKVWTQKDWLIAAHWIREFVSEHPNTEFLNVTDVGLDLSPAVHGSIEDAGEKLEGKSYDLSGYVHHSLSLMSVQHIQKNLNSSLKNIRESLGRSKEILDKMLEAVDVSFASKDLQVPSDHALKNELVYGKLLWPLWQIWQHVIKRGVDHNSGVDVELQMQIHKMIFFKQVVEQHLEVTRG